MPRRAPPAVEDGPQCPHDDIRTMEERLGWTGRRLRPMNATLHLVRHGEVENPKGVIYGRLPGYRLSERGQRQA